MFPFPVKLAAAPGGVNTWTVVRTSTQVQFKLNSNVVDSISAASICWTREAALYYAETYDQGDQAGGTFGDRQNFTNALYEPSVGGSWFSPSFTSCVENPPFWAYFCSRINGQAIDVWTDRS